MTPPPVSSHPLLIKTILQVAPDAFNRCHVNVNKMDISGIVIMFSDTAVVIYFVPGLPMPSAPTAIADQNSKPLTQSRLL